MIRTGKGQSIVEFALIVPILLLLIMGTLDFGRVFYVKIALQSAAREGAYYVSYNTGDKSNCSGGICFQDTILAVQSEANNLGVKVIPADITVIGDLTQGTPVEVSVEQVVNLFIFNFISGPIHVESTARMLVQ